MKPIYLDYNATTPVAPSVQDAMLPYFQERFGNPSSSYVAGQAAMEMVERAREAVALLLGADSDEVIFTSGGTEANNQALKGILLDPQRHQTGRSTHLIISAIEHPAIVQPARYLEQLGIELTVVDCDSQGVVSVDQIEDALRPETVLVSVMHANNEIGTVQPIAEISQLCRRHGVLVHTDAAQSVGKIPVQVESLGVDLLSLAGHKLYAPKGVGALYVRRGTPLSPLLHGANHELGLRAGTENVPYLAGLCQAAKLSVSSADEYGSRVRGLRDRLWSGLQELTGGQLTTLSDLGEGLPNTLSVVFPGVAGADLLAAVPEIQASTGAACHSGSTRLSPTLASLGIDPDHGRGMVRLSLGWYTSSDEVERAVELLSEAWQRLSGGSALG